VPRAKTPAKSPSLTEVKDAPKNPGPLEEESPDSSEKEEDEEVIPSSYLV
jgi:hypothetical protein